MSDCNVNFNISPKDIDLRVKELSQEIYEFYRGNNVSSLYFIFLLTSSFMFASDLLRKLSHYDLKIKTDVIAVKSYTGTQSKEIKLNIEDLERNNLNDKAILIVDDILDTGNTLTHIRKEIIKRFTPKMIDFCCLLKKEDNLRKIDFNVQFLGFKIPKIFVVGYGLDYNGLYRELPYIKKL
ncbi:MAG: hypoxanthine phosphoribosyltransferase [Candidatus Lokiarchaeota archaeon]|nr:hypoxanthine phosphoribosyltransferase [Candidatus Lokiarchaeota archaeon]